MSQKVAKKRTSQKDKKSKECEEPKKKASKESKPSKEKKVKKKAESKKAESKKVESKKVESKKVESKKVESKKIEPKSNNVVPIRGGLPIEVLGAESAYANKVHLNIIDLMHKYEETYFRLAEALYEVRSKKLYRSIEGKYETFEKYVESLGVEYRKARYLVRLWWWYGIEQNQNPKLLAGAQEIGWTKAAELVEVVDGRNASRWFKLAKEMNTRDLAHAARIAKKASDERKTKLESKKREEEKRERLSRPSDKKNEADEHPKDMDVDSVKPPKLAKPFMPEAMSEDLEEPFDDASEGIDPPDGLEEKLEEQKESSKDWRRHSFDIHRDSWQIVDDAFLYAGELGESKHRGHLLSLICLHYVSFYDKQKSVMIGEWLSVLQRLTGLSFIAIDERTNEIAFGSDLIDKLSEIPEDEDECR